jgi:hypothetical protein
VPNEEVEELKTEAQKQIESTLSPAQRAHWRELVSSYYDLDILADSPQSNRQ